MGDVIYHDFRKPKVKPHVVVSRRVGVIIKPPKVNDTMFYMGGNLAESIPFFISFHPSFSPSLYALQTRIERGIVMEQDKIPDPPEAA